MKEVIKEYKDKKMAKYLAALPYNTKVLIVFWHGMGDLLMFLPVYNHIVKIYSDLRFDLCIQAGVGHEYIAPDAIVVDEADFVTEHDMAFVVNFPMGEGDDSMTKSEHCMVQEIGLPPKFFGLAPVQPQGNRLVGVHLQGTCLPGKTNPDDALAERVWNNIIEAGYVPIDLHFEHLYHNKDNVRYPWLTRHCRDLMPSLATLQMLMWQCMAFVGVASGPWVLALTTMPDRTIYLQKDHGIKCYVRKQAVDAPSYPTHRIVDLNNYDACVLVKYLDEICGVVRDVAWTPLPAPEPVEADG